VTDRPTPLTIGFLTVLHDATGTLGGYLLTNSWGRPLEFRLSTAVQPNRVQQILYGRTLTEYLHADLIGKTLIEKASTPPTLIVTDTPTVLPLRTRVEVPVLGLFTEAAMNAVTITHGRAKSPIYLPAAFADDKARVGELLDAVDSSVDLAEPFARVREAVAEARKMGVTGRAA
jgi:hypothetical protein